MQGNIAEVQNHIRLLESMWKDLQSEHDRIEALLDKAEEEQNHQESASAKEQQQPQRGRVTLKDTLTEQIREQKIRSEQLIKVRTYIYIFYCATADFLCVNIVLDASAPSYENSFYPIFTFDNKTHIFLYTA